MANLRSVLRRRAARLALLALPLTAPVAAQAQDADLKAITSYKLTMTKYKQYLDANVNLANVAVKDPSIAEKLDGYGDKSLGEQEKLLNSLPPVRGAITATGFTTRDYLLTQGAMLQAGMAHAFSKGAGMPEDEVIKQSGVSKANLEFYRTNEAEITRLAKEAEARAPKEAAEEEEEADE
jgi:hypothetical protein